MEGRGAQVVEWVKNILDPRCSAEERALCHRHVEELKEHSPDCLTCGFQLACDGDSMIRHFGLQLLEHFVKYRWHSITEESRGKLCLQLLEHISTSILPMEQEAVYVREGLARLVVELAKKRWPQFWPTFLGDLDMLTHCGASQVEVVLLVFRRLAEDLHVQCDASLTAIRRREMWAALREQIGAIFQFLLQNLEFPAVPSLCGVALSTITCYVEWMEWTHLLSNDCKLLRLLYSFISVEQLKTVACECLLAILSRKGDLKRTIKEREKLLILLSKDALQVILDASLQAASRGVDEGQYVFLKRVCQVLVELGSSQIARIWEAQFEAPAGFEFYLKVMLEFFKHQSQLLCMTTASLWSVFLSHSYIINDPAFRNILPDLFLEACKKLIRVGNPCSSSSDAVTEYNKLDFDDQNEYIIFYSMFRNRLTIMLIKMCQRTAIPDNAFSQTLKLGTSLTQQFPSEACSRESMLYLEWDGFVGVMESWTNVMKSDADLKTELSEKATALLHMVLNYDPQDALVLCCVLRCMNSGLMWVVDLDPNKLLQPFLQKIFSCFQYLGALQSKERKVMAAQNIAMQCFVKICTQFGPMLLPYLAQLFEQYSSLAKKSLLTYSMKSFYIEGFVILNLLRPDLQLQAAFLRQLMEEANSVLHELQQCGALTALEGLVRYLGLDATTPQDPAFCSQHRAQLCYVAHVISVVLKNKVPSDGQTGTTVQAAPAIGEQHPCYQLTIPLFTQFVLPLIGLLNELWSGKAKPLISQYFQKLYHLSIAEKEVVRGKVLSFSGSQIGQGDVLSHIQSSLAATLEVCLHCVFNAFSVFGCQHMLDIGFVDSCIQAIFPTTAGLDCWKMRGIIRALVQPLVKLCPADLWHTVLIPFLMQCCHIVYTKLRLSWENIEDKKSSGATDNIDQASGDGEISQEVVDEQFAIFLSRDYANLLETVCIAKKEEQGMEREGLGGGEGGGEEEMEEVREGLPGGQGLNIRDKWLLTHDITPLATDLLANRGPMCELLIISVFSGLAWGDTKCSHTFTTLAGILFVKISAGSLPAQTIIRLFEQVLVALQRHGVHEGNRVSLTSLAQLMYETMTTQQWCCVTQLQELLMQLPGNSAEKMRAFHNLLSSVETAVVCKKRRIKFRELLSGVYQGHISEAFKRPVSFDLPEIVFKKQAKEQSLEPVSLVSLFNEDQVHY